MRYLAGIIVGALALLASAGASAQVSCQVGLETGVRMVDTVAAGAIGLGSYSSQPDVGARVGCDYRIKGSPLVVGAFAGWDYVKLSVPVASISVTSGQEYIVGGRVGYMVSEHVMPYALLGYTHAGNLDWNLSSSSLPSKFNGLTYGGGVEFPITRAFSVALETRYTRFDSEAVGLTGISLQPDELAAMVRVNVTLGSLMEDAPRGRSLK